MRDCILIDRDRNHRFSGRFGGLAYCLGNFVRFAEAISDASLVVTGDDQRAETETASTLHHLRTAVDEHHFLGRVAFLPTITRIVITTISYVTCHIYFFAVIRARTPNRQRV